VAEGVVILIYGLVFKVRDQDLLRDGNPAVGNSERQLVTQYYLDFYSFVQDID
jgi:hypothetical protein